MTDNTARPCVRCRQPRPTRGRGLCAPCRRHLAMYGGVDEFPKLRATSARPDRRCPWCGIKHRSATAECVPCRSLEAGLDQVPAPEDALTGGRWVHILGTRRWVPASKEVAAA